MLGIFNLPNYKRLSLIFTAVFVAISTSFGQLVVNNSQTAQQLVSQILAGNGVYVSNVTFTGSPISLGHFTGGQTTNLGMSEGVVLSTGSIFDIPGPNTTSNKTTNTLGYGDANLASLVPGFSINDAAILEFDFVPMSDTLRFNYVFASEEYPEWVGSMYNDVFGFFVSGPNPAGGSYNSLNIATVPGAGVPVTINNINNGLTNTGPCVNCQYYVSNTPGLTIEFDGFTTELTSKILVIPCTTYHIKIAIGDVADHSFDSGIFLKKNSFTSGILQTSVDYSNTNIGGYAVEGCNNATVSFKLDNPAVYNRVINYQILGSATNGVDYNLLADSMIIPLGSDSVSFQIIPNADAIIEGTENIILIVETSSCSYDTITIDIHEYFMPEVNITGPSLACFKDTIAVSTIVTNGTAPFNYLWSNGLTTNHFNHILLADTSFIVTVIDQCFNQTTDTLQITTNPLPTISATSSLDSICSGNQNHLTANGAISYNWLPSTYLNTSSGPSVISTPHGSITYIITGTDINGCKSKDTLILNVLPLPLLNITANPSSICIGDSTTLLATGAISYLWDNALTLSSTTINNPVAFPVTSTTYKVIGTGANGCKDSTYKTISVNLLPTIQIIANDSGICRGESATLTASGATNYTWNPTFNISAPTGSTVIATPMTNEMFFVNGTDGNGCRSRDSIEIVVYDNPVISVTPTDTSICDNSSTILTATGAFSYNWLPSTNLSATTGSLVTASPLTTTNYMVVGFDTNGCSDTVHALVRVSPSPVISPTNPQICLGDSAIITVSSTLPNTSYLWNTGAVDSVLRIKPLVSAIYSVTATDPSGCVGTMSSNVTVNPLPSISSSQSNDTICRGQSVSLSSSGAINYSWSPSNYLLTNVGNNNTATPDSTVEITIIGYDLNNCTDTYTISIHVNQLPDVNVAPLDSVICRNTPITLTASGASSYSWSPATGLSNTTNPTTIANISNNSNYVVSGTDANGCTSTDTVNLTVSPMLSATANPAQICLGDSTLLSATGNNGCTFLWSNGSTNSQFYDHPIITTTYLVTATDTLGCSDTKSVLVTVSLPPVVSVSVSKDTICKGETSVLTASGALNYSWSPSTGLSSTSGATVNAKPTTPKVYQVVGINGLGCTDTVLVPIHVHQVMNLTSTTTSSILCNGQSTLITASGAPNFIWSPTASLTALSNDSMIASPSISTSYKIIGVDTNGCHDSIYRNIVVNAIPSLSLNPIASNICQGQSKTLTASGAASYSWSPSNSLSNSNTSSTIATPTATTTYTIIGTTTQGCIDSLHAVVNVNPLPNLTTNSSTPHVCLGDTALIIVSGANFYNWTSTSALFSYTNDSLEYAPRANETYRVIGTTAFGCRDTAFINLTVSPIPNISPTNPEICPGESILLIASSNISPTLFTWGNGVINDSNTVSPTTSTTYNLTLTDTTGCVFDTVVSVAVNPIPLLSINPPNPELCPGSEIKIKATGAHSYQWLGSGITPITNDSIKATPLSTVNYTLIGTSNSGCIDSLGFQILVHPAANVNLSPTSSYICSGNTQTLVATGTSTYSWSPATGLSTTTNDTVVSSAQVNTLYTVTGIDTNNCSDTAMAWVRVYDNPVLSPSNPWKCPDDTIVINTVLSNSALSYLWSTGDTTASISVHNDTLTTYTVTVTYPQGCQKTTSTISNVYTVNPVVATSSDYSICPGDTTYLNGANALTYSWSPTNSLINSTSSSVKAQPSSTTTYNLLGIDGHGCKSNDTVTINVYPQPNMYATPSSQVICRGDTAIINYGGAVSYVWTSTSNVISNNGSTLLSNPITDKIFKVAGTDTNGCVDIDTATILVDNGSPLSITPLNPAICQGDTLTLYVSGAQSYSWSPNFWIVNTTGDSAQVFPSSNIVYYVHGLSANGCPSDTSVYVNVKRKPMITVTPSQDSICFGDTVKLIACGAGGNGNYVWSPSVAASNIFGDTVFVSPTSTTTYQITGISTDNCYKSISANIKVNPLPLVQIIADTTEICFGDSVEIKPSGATSYTWSSSSPFIFDNDSIITWPSTTNQYNIVGSNIYGCVAKDSTLITVHQLPVVSVLAQDTVICLHDSTTLTPSGASSYIWQQTNINVTGNGIGHVSPAITSSFSVIGIDNYNCKDIDSIEITVNPIPVINSNSTAYLVCDSNQITLSATSNMSPTTFAWNTGDSVASFDYYPELSANYIVEGTNIFGCKNSDTVHVQVNPYPILTTNFSDSIICLGDSVSLIGLSSINPVNFIWSNNSIANNITVAPSSFATYSLKITDSIGCADSTTFNISTKQKPTVDISTLNNPICKGDTAFITAIANMAVSNYTYSFGAPSNSSVFFKPNNTQNVWVKVTDSIGCYDYDTLTQYVNQIPIVSISSNHNSICRGDSVVLTASSTFQNISFLWNTGSTSTSIDSKPSVTTTYTVQASDTLGCTGTNSKIITVYQLPTVNISSTDTIICNGETITLTANSTSVISSFVWNNSWAGQNQNATPIISQDYSVSITDNHGCKDRDTLSITVNQIPEVEINPTLATICEDDSIQFTFTSTNPVFSILWSNGSTGASPYFHPAGSANHSIIITDSNGCVGYDTNLVNVIPKPTVDIYGDSIFCTADSTTIYYSGTGTPAGVYNWDFHGGTLLSGSGKNPHCVKYASAGNQLVTLTVDENGCTSDPDSLTLKVSQTPIVDFIAIPIVSCESLLVQFDNLTPNIKTWDWNFGNPFTSDDTSSLENPSYRYDIQGTYSVGLQVVSNDNCPASAIYNSMITVYPNPVANFGAFPVQTFFSNGKITMWNFSDLTLDFEWDFDDPKSGINNYSTEKYPWHQFQDTGIFNIRLVVIDEHGCTDTAYDQVVILPEPAIFLPNAFTPNGDGLNDYFGAYGHDYDWSTFEFYIFNRWGEVIFETRDYTQMWDGRMNGKLVENGVYNYLIRVKSKQHKEDIYRGEVTVLR